MNRYRWWLLLILVFVAVFGTVLWWPVSPMWTHAIEFKGGSVQGYIHNGKSIMVAYSDSYSRPHTLAVFEAISADSSRKDLY